MDTSRRPSGVSSPAIQAPQWRRPSHPSGRAGGGSAGGGFRLALLVLLFCGLVFALFLATQAEDTSDIRGLGSDGQSARNLKAALAIGLSGTGTTTITEAEINRYVAVTSKLEQGGALAEKAKIEDAAVRLRDGSVEVVIRRELFGRPHTVSTRFRVSQTAGEGGKRVWEVVPEGGRIGRLPMGGQLVRLTMGPSRALADAYQAELNIVRHASSVRLEDNRLSLGAVTVQNR